MAINKVIYGADTLVDLTEDTVTAEDVLNSKSFHTPDGVKRTGTASYPVTDVQVNGESVLDGTIAKIVESIPGEQTSVDSFTTETGGLLKSAIVQLDPIQDLNGYDNPWPAGGGKNKYSVLVGEDTYDDNVSGTTHSNSDGQLVINMIGAMNSGCFSKSNAAFRNITSNLSGTYTISCEIKADKEMYVRYRVSGYEQATVDFTANTTWQKKSITIPLDSTERFVIFYNQSTTAGTLTVRNLQIEEGSTATDWTPYSNICPISGHTEVDLYNVGKNLINWNFYPFNENRLEVTLNAGTYILSGKSTIAGGNAYIRGQKANGTYCTKAELGFPTWGDSATPNVYYGGAANQTFTITIPEDGVRLEFGKLNNDGTVPAQLEKGNQATPFEPHKGHLYTVQIGQTVYGGTVDFVTGEMTVTHGYLDASSVTWSEQSNSRWFYNGLTAVIKIPPSTSTPTETISDRFVAISNVNMANTTNIGLSVNASGSLVIRNGSTTIQPEGQIVYPLATPKTIQLTPQQIEALVGQNNLSAPLTSQEVISTTYEQIASFNAVLDDVNQSSESTYSSEKIEESYVGKDDVETKSATDSFVTTNGGLLSKCVIDLVPVQSGSGDPYPAGGGKNKLPLILSDIKARNTSGTWSGNVYTINNVTFTVLTDDGENITGIKVNGTASANISFLYGNQLTLGSDGYILTGCPSGGSTNTYMQGWNVSGYPAYVDTGSGYTVSSNLYGVARYVGISIINGTAISNLTFYPMIRLATETDPTFEPYSNVRPISGHTEVDLYNVGKNYAKYPLIFQSAPNADMSSIKIYLPVGNYTASFDSINDATTWRFYIKAYEADGTLIKDSSLISNTSPYNEFRNDQNGWINSGNTNSKVQKFTIEKSGYYSFGLAYGNTTGSTITTNFQIEEGSAATDYETYNPNSKLYQVQIGSTVYGGYVDLVSGEMVATYGIIDMGDLTYTKYTQYMATAQINDILYGLTQSEYTTSKLLYCTAFNATSNMLDNTPNCIRAMYYTANPKTSMRQLVIFTSAYDTADAFKTAMTGQKIVYKLATPTTINLTPKQIEALVGQNNLSCPLSGQSIETNGVEYKELFTFADVKEYVKPLIPYSNAGSHNAIYRGKYLGDHVTPEQWASIVAGTFDDLFIGDYWTINSVNWRIAHFDYWLGTGDTECTTHHAVIVPDTNLYTSRMNASNDTTGGYYNSEMRGGTNYLVSGSSNLYSASETIKSAFGSSHILTHREILTNTVSSGNASNWAWYDSSVDLMSEVMVYGTLAWSIGGKGFEVGDGKCQFALFRHDISKATIRADWWLRGVSSAAYFASVNVYGDATYHGASNSYGVRPCFAIK